MNDSRESIPGKFDQEEEEETKEETLAEPDDFKDNKPPSHHSSTPSPPPQSLTAIAPFRVNQFLIKDLTPSES